MGMCGTKIICVIPARYNSTRYPGKPLVDINGKPMIWWVYQQCLKVEYFDEIYVATDDFRIKEVCDKFNMRVMMTSESHKTGTDRVAEVSSRVRADIIVNVQGDEPLIEPEVISEVIKPMVAEDDLQVSSLMTKIKNPVDLCNFTICKVITNAENYCVYLTRSPAPYPKGSLSFDYYKALGVFAFRPDSLKFFSEYGKRIGKGKIESIEDIELLRFIENGYKVKFSEVMSESIAIDTPNDLCLVLSKLSGDKT